MHHITNGSRRHCAPAPATVPPLALCGLVGEQAMTDPAGTAAPLGDPGSSAAWCAFDSVNHPSNTWGCWATIPTPLCRAQGTSWPLMTIEHPDEPSETVQWADCFRAT